ncbi:MAG: recombinase family protein [Oscillospiraceae bacterium]|nr:recombinase family protein [Oscillospiraceae bacterium]
MNTAPNVRIIPAKISEEEKKKQYHQLRVAAYCRISTDLEEQQNSYEVQVEYYTDYINQNKEWRLAGIFADKGISGTSTLKRTAFNRMIRMCQKKKIDLILCKSASRFARNTVDCLEYIRMLRSLGVAVIFEKENINTSNMDSEFMLTLYSSFSQAESESISKNVTLGIQMGFREGRVRYQYRYWLGYRKGADGKPEIVPEEAEIIKQIFRLFLDGESTQHIADVLNQQGVKTISGGMEWRADAVWRILKNEKYAGDALLQKTYTTDCISHKSVRNKGERTMYLVSDCHPAIIDRETFNLVQQETARRSSKRKISDRTRTEQGKYSSKYALTELMICGECGTPYRRVTWNVHGKKTIVWRCISRLDHGNRYCKNSPTIHEEPLHRAILKAINQFYDCQNEISGVILESTESVLIGLEQNGITEIERRLADIQKARNDMINLIVSGAVGEDSLDTEFEKLFHEEQELGEKLTVLKRQAYTNSETQNQISTILNQMEHTKLELHDFDDVLVRKLLECVRVIDKTHIQIIFRGGYETDTEVEKK